MKAFVLYLLFAMMSIFSTCAKTVQTWIENRELCDTVFNVAVADDYRSLSVEVCGSMNGLRDCRGMNRQLWYVELTSNLGEARRFTVGWGNDNHGDIDDARFLCIDGVGPEPVKFVKGVNTYGGDNTLFVTVDRENKAQVFVGSDALMFVGEVPIAGSVTQVTLGVTGRMDLDVMWVGVDVRPQLESGLDKDVLQLVKNLTGGPAGLWKYLDRDNDIDYARMGGHYQLAILPSEDTRGEYLIIYMEGGEVNAGEWKQGMIKGRMTETRFAGRYELMWYDVNGDTVDDESSAIVDGDVITFNFPLHYTQLRYSRTE